MPSRAGDEGMKNEWPTPDTVTIAGPVTCVDFRTRWQRFKDFFKPRRKLVFDSKERIIHEADFIKMP
mgnify:CR=1 FL=1